MHLSLVLFTGSRRTVFLPQDKRTALQCRVFGSPLLKCRFTDKFISLDHRCDLTPVTRSFPPVPESELYPSNQTPLAPFIDGRGRASRLFWGRETELPAPEFYSGKGYRHIAAKHGWGPADEQATRNAIHTRPITTETTKVKRRRLVRRTYEGGGYRQNLASCRRVVVIDYPIRSRSGGEMITSYGALVGEPGSPLPSQG